MTEARSQFSELINRVGYGKERIVLTRHGKALVALVPAEELANAAPDAGQATLLDLSAQSSRSRPTTGIAAEHRSD